jgi:hypothetical protein
LTLVIDAGPADDAAVRSLHRSLLERWNGRNAAGLAAIVAEKTAT